MFDFFCFLLKCELKIFGSLKNSLNVDKLLTYHSAKINALQSLMAIIYKMQMIDTNMRLQKIETICNENFTMFNHDYLQWIAKKINDSIMWAEIRMHLYAICVFDILIFLRHIKFNALKKKTEINIFSFDSDKFYHLKRIDRIR